MQGPPADHTLFRPFHQFGKMNVSNENKAIIYIYILYGNPIITTFRGFATDNIEQ